MGDEGRRHTREHSGACSRHKVPDADGLVSVARDELSSGLVEENLTGERLVPNAGHLQTLSGQTPDADGGVETARDNQLPVEGQGVDAVGVMRQEEEADAAGGAPDAHGAIVTARDDFVIAKANTSYRSHVT